MRITSGHLKGRTIRVPAAGVRPSQDRLRESLFSSLGGRLDGWRVLDLFAGSGALGLEAWSRGAHEVVWIESHPRTFAVLRENVRALCLPEAETTRHARCVRGDAMSLQRWGRQLGRSIWCWRTRRTRRSGGRTSRSGSCRTCPARAFCVRAVIWFAKHRRERPGPRIRRGKCCEPGEQAKVSGLYSVFGASCRTVHDRISVIPCPTRNSTNIRTSRT